ncbi:hypothetical protein [Flavobacterium restrictum]|nr:hypothetical protein [Flavobacterium restrictum]
MAKIYSKKNALAKEMKPKQEVVSFLLSYSKALHILKLDNKNFEFIAN